jgi:hypothetical protein
MRPLREQRVAVPDNHAVEKAKHDGHEVETGFERIRRHIRRPHPNKMITDQIRSTVYPIDPRR